ncbi:Uncharacterized protein Fot_42146 [Forsythia ovata]|uniref:Uncharacterized protein n=1 Tax=Forsythia ovata TaxID=205694 RepID=A0ABD1RKB6_9LAMI
MVPRWRNLAGSTLMARGEARQVTSTTGKNEVHNMSKNKKIGCLKSKDCSESLRDPGDVPSSMFLEGIRHHLGHRQGEAVVSGGSNELPSLPAADYQWKVVRLGPTTAHIT